MSVRLKVNPIACEAHGMCAEVLPERITLDDWGYPIIDEQPITPELLNHAKRAAQACPTFALLIERPADHRALDAGLDAPRPHPPAVAHPRGCAPKTHPLPPPPVSRGTGVDG